MGWGTLVGMATLRAEGSGDRVPVGGGRDIPHPCTLVLGLTRPSVQGVLVPFVRVKRPGRGVDYPPQSSAEAIE